MLDLKRVSVPFMLLLVFTLHESRAQQKPFNLHGIYLEGCSCKMTCACNQKNTAVKGCRGMGAIAISSGRCGNSDLSGVKIAFAFGDKWVRIYVQAKNHSQSEVADHMARALFNFYGTIEEIRDAKIELSGDNGDFTLNVDGGRILHLHSRLVPNPFILKIMHAKVISGSFADGGHHITLEGTSSFFNQDWAVSGQT